MAIAAVGQLCSTASMTHNLAQVQILVRKAVAAGAQALFLPEATDYIASSPAETVSLCQPVHKSPFVLGVQQAASQARLPINVGIHEPTAGGGKVKNTLIWIGESGEIERRYQKLHLFDVEIEGGPVLRESRSVEPGKEIVAPFDTAVGRVGMLICFDLRFPEPSLTLRNRSAQLITYPSAFTVPTGRAHWEPLLRARAIETQSYIVAAAQAGRHNEKRVSYGHSMIVGPWGDVLAEVKGDDDDDEVNDVNDRMKKKKKKKEPEIAVAEIDLGVLERVRREVPLLRRT